MSDKREWLTKPAFQPVMLRSVRKAVVFAVHSENAALCTLMQFCACKPKAALDCPLHVNAERWRCLHVNGCLSMLLVFPAANDNVARFHTGLCWPAMLDPRAIVKPQVTPHLELNPSVYASYLFFRGKMFCSS